MNGWWDDVLRALNHWDAAGRLGPELNGLAREVEDEARFVGLDWAEDHHDVFVEDDTGARLGGGRLPDGVEGVARFHELVAGYVDPADVVVATETDRGLFIGTLVAAGYAVLAVNPLSQPSSGRW